MDGMDVPDEDIAAAGEATMRVADGVRAVDVVEPTRSLIAALPGGTIAEVGPEVESTWGSAVTRLANVLTGQADRLTAAAAAYAEAEAMNVEAMSPTYLTGPR